MKPSTRLALSLLKAAPEGVTSLEALYAGCGSRMASRVSELREAGYEVVTDWVTTDKGARIARYRLIQQPAQLGMALA